MGIKSKMNSTVFPNFDLVSCHTCDLSNCIPFRSSYLIMYEEHKLKLSPATTKNIKMNRTTPVMI